MPKKLSVHKNTVEKRRKRELSKNLSSACVTLCKEADIRAYAIVGIDATGQAHAFWDTGSIMPAWGFPDTMGAILRRDMEECDIDETWVPPILPLKG